MSGLCRDNGKENGNYCLGFRVWGFEFRVPGLGFRVWSCGFDA